MSTDFGDYIESPFPHPWWHPRWPNVPQAKTVDEWTMLDLVNMMKDKPDWKTKVNDETFLTNWKHEIKQQWDAKAADIDTLISLVIKELKWTIKTEQTIIPYKVSVDERIICSNEVINENLRLKVIEQIDSLKLSFKVLDYHPGSNKQIINLVHPSLYAFQYYITPIINEKGEIEVLKYNAKYLSAKKVHYWGLSNHQLLPSLFKYNHDSNIFEIKSYINNLHPIKHKSLYLSLQSIFNEVIPGINYVLSKYASKELIRIKWDDGEYYREKFLDESGELIDDDDDGGDFDENCSENLKLKDKLIPPIINSNHYNDVTIDLKSFDEIKVIVKIIDIELTPENPVYEGSSWSVAGLINEDIIATIGYFYDEENITQSYLSFQVGFADPDYKDGDSNFCEQVYGIKERQEMTRQIGSIGIKPNQIVIFPNIIQSQNESFQLKDMTKPGKRRAIYFYLVDPYNNRVISTEKVPIQQQDWWEDNILPLQLKQKIQALNCELPRSMEIAKEVRQKLIWERAEDSGEDIYSVHPYIRKFELY